MAKKQAGSLPSEMLPGTLDMLVLQTLLPGPAAKLDSMIALRDE